jgi:hypothetical protein
MYSLIKYISTETLSILCCEAYHKQDQTNQEATIRLINLTITKGHMPIPCNIGLNLRLNEFGIYKKK